jgi:hypothetical protein
MRPAVIAPILAAVLASGATVLLARSLDRPGGRSVPDPTVEDLRARLDGALRDLAAVRARLEEREGAARRPGTAPAPAGGGSEGSPADVPAVEGGADPPGPAPGAAPPEADAAGEEEPESRSDAQAREAARRLAPAAAERLRELGQWDDSVDVRQRWILTPEATLVNEFGKPDEIWLGESGAETWAYRVPTGEVDDAGRPLWKDVTLEIHRGRLVRVWN